MALNYRDVVPNGKVVSKAQYHFYQRCLDQLGPDQKARRAMFLDALEVDYATLPDNAKSGRKRPYNADKVNRELDELAPTPKIQVSRWGKGLVTYWVRDPHNVFFISNEHAWKKLHEECPDIPRSHCMTLAEARSFMELEGVKVKSLEEAARWWASDAPAEPEPQLPQLKAPTDDHFTWDSDIYGGVI